MKNQWTTVSDDSGNTALPPTEGTPPPSKRDNTSRNRRISVAFASTGVFLMLVGAAPFLFRDSEAPQYSAFLTPQGIEEEDGEPLANTEEVFLPGEEMLADAQGGFGGALEVDVNPDFSDETEPTTEEAPIGEIGAGDSSGETEENPFSELIEETASEEDPSGEFEIVLENNEGSSEIITENPEEGVPVLTEKVDFPIEVAANTQENGVIDFGTTTDLHGAAPVAPQTGTPLIPLLVFSTLAAFGFRLQKKFS